MRKLPDLANLFLTRQGEKIPPVTCSSGTDAAVIQEVIGLPVTSPDPKGSGSTQDLAAFEFEVRFDHKLVCVNLEPGPAAENMTCLISDKDSSQLEGIARIACFTTKGAEFPDTTTEEGRHLADIVVRPQPELYSQIIANQDNGIAVQILNQGCELSDAQGHPIPILSCEDADITVRYLEGDVDADCKVDAASDGQMLAFRWGAETGNLLYNARYDLEPTASAGGGGVNGDGDIDVKDIQFVLGRHGSTCAAPNPPQPPVNPKG